MAKYTEEQLNTCSKEMLVTLLLSMQDQLEQLNKNFEKLSEQLTVMNNQRYGRSSEKLSVMDGQLSPELFFNEAEAVMETLYVVEPQEDQVLPKKKRSPGKREAELKDLPEEVLNHTLPEEKLTEIFGANGWKQLPDEVYRRVRVQPAVYTVEVHHVAVYAGKDNQTMQRCRKALSCSWSGSGIQGNRPRTR